MDMVHGDWAVGHGVLARWYMETDPWYMESGTWQAWYMVTLTHFNPELLTYFPGDLRKFLRVATDEDNIHAFLR